MQQVRSPRVDRIARLIVAGCLVGGPLAGMVVRGSLPSPATASIARSVADYASNPGATRAVLIADAFLFLLVPAALGATVLAWRRAPVLALLAGVVSLIGWSAIVMLAAQDALFAVAGRQVYAAGQGAAIATTWSNEPLVAGTIGAFIAGHLLGTVLLGAALWRARAIPRWAALCIALSMPLHLAAFLADFKLGDMGAWVLLLVGFAVCARVYVAGWDVQVASAERRVSSAVPA